MTTFERLCAILVNEHRMPLDRLTLDARLDGLGIDALGTVELLWNVEDSLKIKLPWEPVRLLTLGDLVSYVDEVLAGLRVPHEAALATTPTLRVC